MSWQSRSGGAGGMQTSGYAASQLVEAVGVGLAVVDGLGLGLGLAPEDG